MISQTIEVYSYDYFTKRDLKLAQEINFIKYSNILIIGNFPLSLGLYLKRIGCKVTILEDFELLKIYKDQINNLFDIDVIISNPLFDDLSKYINNYDLIVYYESELLVPFNCLKYKHNNDVLVLNSFTDYYRYNGNIVYDPNDLPEVFDFTNVYKIGKVDFINGKQTFYCLGRVS